MRARPQLAVLAAITLACCHWQLASGQATVSASGSQVVVSTPPALTAALRDPSVWDILVTADIDMASELASWAALPGDIQLNHNLTIQGPPGQYPAINFRYWKLNGTALRGLTLAPGITVTIKHLTFMQTVQLVPPVLLRGSSTTWLALEACVWYSFVGDGPELALNSFLAVPSFPWEPVGYRKGLVLPMGFCRVEPTPVCWDFALVLLTYMTEYSNTQIPDSYGSACKVRLTDFVMAREELLTPECAQEFRQGNLTCFWRQLGEVMARIPPGSLWPSPPPPPDRVAAVNAAYVAALTASRSGQASRSRAVPASSDTDTSSKKPFPAAAVGGAIGAVVIAALAAFIAFFYHSKRNHKQTIDIQKGMQPDSRQCYASTNAGQACSAHSQPTTGNGCARQTQHTGGDVEGQTSVWGGASSGYAQPSHATSGELPSASLGSRIGLVDRSTASNTASTMGKTSSSHVGYFQLSEMVTPHSPITPLITDLKIGVNVVLGPKIGEGAMGSVYRATYQGQPVAVKLLNQGTDVKTYMTELGILGRTQHPNVVKLIGACVSGDQLALVEELADGSLEQLMFPARPKQQQAADQEGCDTSLSETQDPVLLPLPLVLHIAMEVATGLAYLHPTIIHRDLKPGNVLLTEVARHSTDAPDAPPPGPHNIHVLLSDFGLSRIFDSMTWVTDKPNYGTVPYMAPECFVHRGTLTHKCDIYSFGILLWELLHGVRAWKGHNPAQVVYEVMVNHQRPVMSASDTRCLPALRNLIERCWQADIDLRPPALEIVRELAVIQQQLSQTAADEAAAVLP